MYVIGKTGMGKSTLLENMAAQDRLRPEDIVQRLFHGGPVASTARVHQVALQVWRENDFGHG